MNRKVQSIRMRDMSELLEPLREDAIEPHVPESESRATAACVTGDERELLIPLYQIGDLSLARRAATILIFR
jgi:hypothetical protein